MDSTSASPQRSCSCPPTRRVAEMQCGSQVVVSFSVCCGAKEIVAWTVQKACSYLSLHDAREHALRKVGPDRREEYLNLKYVVTVAKSHAQKDCQSCHETTVLSVGDILSSYGLPLFIRYQLVPPAAAPRVTVNAFDVLMREPQLQWPDKVSKGINAKLDLKSDFQTWLEKRKVGWLATQVQTHGAPFINTMAEALWYVDGQHDKLHARACTVPAIFQQFSGYNKPEKHGHKLPTFSAKLMKTHAQHIEQLTLPAMAPKTSVHRTSSSH